MIQSEAGHIKAELFGSSICENFLSLQTIHVILDRNTVLKNGPNNLFKAKFQCVGSFHLQQVSIFHPSGVHIQDMLAACDE